MTRTDGPTGGRADGPTHGRTDRRSVRPSVYVCVYCVASLSISLPLFMCRVPFVSCGCRPVAAMSNGATNHLVVVLNICVWVCPVGSLRMNLFVNHVVNPFASLL